MNQQRLYKHYTVLEKLSKACMHTEMYTILINGLAQGSWVGVCVFHEHHRQQGVFDCSRPVVWGNLFLYSYWFLCPSLLLFFALVFPAFSSKDLLHIWQLPAANVNRAFWACCRLRVLIIGTQESKPECWWNLGKFCSHPSFANTSSLALLLFFPSSLPLLSSYSSSNALISSPGPLSI